MSRPTASLSSTTAVGLVSPLSISEIIDRLTPLRSASPSSDSPRAARNWRTLAAICSLRPVSLIQAQASYMLDQTSIILDELSSAHA